jgi:ABC-2 type transport system permease protein
MGQHFSGDTAVLLGRSLKHVYRSVDTVITTAVMPVAFMLLFVYVFGGAIDHGSGSYVNYLLPGILLITIASGLSYTAFRLYLDMKSGIFQRLQSMPIARSSVLWSHVLTSLVANLISLIVVVGVALAIGFRSGASVQAWLAVIGILILFTLALTWIAVIPGLSAKSADGASAFSYPLIFLPFVSSAFEPTDTMPGPVRAFADHQPGHLHRPHRPRLVHPAVGRLRHMDRARLAGRPHHRRVQPRHSDLSPTDPLAPAAKATTWRTCEISALPAGARSRKVHEMRDEAASELKRGLTICVARVRPAVERDRADRDDAGEQ